MKPTRKLEIDMAVIKADAARPFPIHFMVINGAHEYLTTAAAATLMCGGTLMRRDGAIRAKSPLSIIDGRIDVEALPHAPSGNEPSGVTVDEYTEEDRAARKSPTVTFVTQSWHHIHDDTALVKCSNNQTFSLKQHEVEQLSAGQSITRPGVTITATAGTQQAADAGTIIPITVTPDVAPTWTESEMRTMKLHTSPWDTDALNALRLTHGLHKYTAMMTQVYKDEDREAADHARAALHRNQPSQSMIDQVARLARIEFDDAVSKRLNELSRQTPSRVHLAAIVIVATFVAGTLCGVLVSLL